MANTYVFTAVNAVGQKHLRAIEDHVLPALASGSITVTENGKPAYISAGNTSFGHVVGHPTDPKQDKHAPHSGGRKMDAPVSVTFDLVPNT